MFRSERLARGNSASYSHALGHAEEALRVWLCRLRWRHELSRLDADQLRDVGLNEEMIRREAAKPFWRE